ncbi:MAG: hypothetical protein H6686_02635 [Fibrobacteria bacterium]|nr:hypothetical protein [Fibrobacteria bacterium]
MRDEVIRGTLLLCASVAMANGSPLAGEVELDQRSHWNPGATAQEEWNAREVSILPRYEQDLGPISLRLSPRWKIRRTDREALFEPGDSRVRATFRAIDLVVGWERTSWGVMDALSVMDIVDPFDWTDPFEERARVERLVTRLSIAAWESGTFQLMLFPWFPRYPTPRLGERFNTMPLPSRQVVSGDRGRGTPSFAARWSASLGGFDFGLVGYRGVDRDPDPVPTESWDAIRLVHGEATAAGLGVAKGFDALILRGEFLATEAAGRRDLAGAAGGELEIGQWVPIQAGVVLVGEYSFHSKPSATEILQDDVYGGLRIDFQNTASTRLEAGWVRDLEYRTLVQRATLSQNLSDRVSVDLVAQSFILVDDADGRISPLRGDDYVEARFQFRF